MPKAQSQGQSSAIKSYGQQLIADHTKSDQEVKAAAQKAGLSIDDSALTAHDREMMKIDPNKMDQLKTMKGAEFDRTFAQVLAKDHDHMVSMLREHKDMAEKAEKGISRSSNQARSAPAPR